MCWRLFLPFPRAGHSHVAVLALASTSRGDLKTEEEPRRMGVEPITSNRRCNHVGFELL